MLKNLTKAQAFRQFRANADMGAFEMLWTMRESIPGLIDRSITEQFSKVRKEAQAQIEADARQILAQVTDALVERYPALVDREVKKLFSDMPKPKDGKTPRRGIDYFTAKEQKAFAKSVAKLVKVPEIKPAADGYTPQPGIDYPTETQVKEMVDTAVARLFIEKDQEDESGAVEAVEAFNVAAEVAKQIDFMARAAEVARALESLKGAERLDYNALKNTPGVKAYEEHARPMLRGGAGASEPRYYDLSDLLDGVTKTFPIPLNRRVLGVWGTQFPGGAFRPEVDWTRTTTTLTLTSEVGAPEAGQTLYILYVPV